MMILKLTTYNNVAKSDVVSGDMINDLISIKLAIQYRKQINKNTSMKTNPKNCTTCILTLFILFFNVKKVKSTDKIKCV